MITFILSHLSFLTKIFGLALTAFAETETLVTLLFVIMGGLATGCGPGSKSISKSDLERVQTERSSSEFTVSEKTPISFEDRLSSKRSISLNAMMEVYGPNESIQNVSEANLAQALVIDEATVSDSALSKEGIYHVPLEPQKVNLKATQIKVIVVLKGLLDKRMVALSRRAKVTVMKNDLVLQLEKAEGEKQLEPFLKRVKTIYLLPIES